MLWRPAGRVWEPATIETSPVPLAEMRDHARAPIEDDALLAVYLAAGVSQVERLTQRLIVERAAVLRLPGWPPVGMPIELPGGPVSGVTSVTYASAGGGDVTLDPGDYTVAGRAPARLALRLGAEPLLADVPLPLTAAYVVGHGECPPALAVAAMMIGAELYDRRAETSERRLDAVPYGAARLMAPWRIPAIG